MNDTEGDGKPATHERGETAGSDATSVQRSSWWAVLIGASFVILVAALFSYILSEDADERSGSANPPAFAGGFFDDFNRPADSDGLSVGGPVIWSSERGQWGLQVGVAFIVVPDPVINVVVTDLGSDSSSISAFVGGQGVCGVVARYSDPGNYTALVRVPGFAVWNLIEVVGGTERILTTLPDITDNNVGVGLAVADDVVVASVGIRQASVVERSSLTGTRVGLIAKNEEAGMCTWDNVGSQEAR